MYLTIKRLNLYDLPPNLTHNETKTILGIFTSIYLESVLEWLILAFFSFSTFNVPAMKLTNRIINRIIFG